MLNSLQRSMTYTEAQFGRSSADSEVRFRGEASRLNVFLVWPPRLIGGLLPAADEDAGAVGGRPRRELPAGSVDFLPLDRNLLTAEILDLA